MEQNPRIQGFKTKQQNTYVSNYDLVTLLHKKHKNDNSSAFYMDEINFNYQISSKSFYRNSKFIYVIRSPEQCLSQIINFFNYKPISAARYYSFRLRRICEMASYTKDAVLLTFDDLMNGRGIEFINNYLELKKPIEFNPSVLEEYDQKTIVDRLESTLRSEIYDNYERYLYFLRNQSLLQTRL